MTSIARISTSSSVAARVGGDEADRDSERDAEQRSRGWRARARSAAPEEAAEDVAPEVVGPDSASLDGVAYGGPLDEPVGEYGAKSRPKTAMPTSRSVMPSPIFVRCCRQAARGGRPGPVLLRPADVTARQGPRPSSSKRGPQPRADEDRGDVGEEVEDDVQRRDEERDRLHDGHVARATASTRSSPMPG